MADEEVDSSIGSDDDPLLDLANQAGRGNFLEKGSKAISLTASTKREERKAFWPKSIHGHGGGKGGLPPS